MTERNLEEDFPYSKTPKNTPLPTAEEEYVPRWCKQVAHVSTGGVAMCHLPVGHDTPHEPHPGFYSAV